MLNFFAKLITKNNKLVVLISILLIIPCIYGTVMTRINYDVLSYLPKDKESVIGENVLEDKFKTAATTFLMIDNMPQSDVKKLSKKIKEIPAVNDVIYVRDIVGIGIPKNFLPKELSDIFYSQNGELLMIKYEEKAASESTMQAIDEMNKLLNEQCFISGLSVLLKDIKQLILTEMPRYVLLAGILSLIVLIVCLESWVLPFIFMATIGIGIIYNFGTNIFLGEISYITQAIASILQLAVTMDYAIFVVHRYDEEKNNYDDKKIAMQHAIVGAFLSLAGSSLTTVAGFGALCFMSFTLGMDLGLVMMKGVILGVLTCVTFLPALILIFDKVIHKYTHKSLIPEFHRLTDFILEKRKTAILIFLIAFLPALYYQSHVSVYYDISRALPKTLQSNIGKDKLENDFGMGTSHMIVMKDDIENKEMKKMFNELEDVKGIKRSVGYEKFIGPAIPDSFIPQNLKDMFKKDSSQMILISSKYLPATDEVNEQIDKIISIAKKYDDTSLVTGEAALTKDLADTVNTDIKTTNFLSILAIFLIVAIVFKSVSIPFILVSCIELAIFINMAIPSVLSHSVAFVTPIVIGAIQLGATVDYSILLTTRFQEELRKGLDKKTAIQTATQSSAKSIITSVLVFLSANLGVIFLSTLDIIKGICVTLARGSIISGLVILFILPPILYVLEGFINKTSLKWKN
ncbi:MAG: efflux RND transporter permease subunit [Peptoanaerobacter stomatis]|uniref:efflux RND transporter permease subunit n=1 Tax=Peptoanaerobacter stomatis TaxID=796937 RepID=UPI003FA15D27